MPFENVTVSEFDEPEPGAVSGVWVRCRDARRSLSSLPPSFCLQPVSSPSPRLGGLCGHAPGGRGPRPAPPSFVFVLGATLAACCAALALEEFVRENDVFESLKAASESQYKHDVSESLDMLDGFAAPNGYVSESLLTGVQETYLVFVTPSLESQDLLAIRKTKKFPGKRQVKFQARKLLVLPISRHFGKLSSLSSAFCATWPSSLRFSLR